MPLHVPPISRRRFLAGSLAAGAGWLTIPQLASAEVSVNADRFALLSDTHIAANPEQMVRGVKMAENLRRVVAEVTSLAEKPAGVFVNGDCALLIGEPGDYATFHELTAPLATAGLPLHLTLGNHDQRKNFESAIGDPFYSVPLEGHYVSIVESPRANWFLLDSLDVVNQIPGVLGAEQRAWLAKALDARAEKPAIVFVHHNLVFGKPEKNTGLLDSDELLELLVPRKHVKAVFYGHTHHWNVQKKEGIHLVNLPPTAYLFLPMDPNGWVDCRLRDGGMTLELHALDPKHRAGGEQVKLEWRTG
jgi:hypothetical protein